MRLLTTFLLLLISCGTVPPTNDLLGAWIGVESWNESFVGLVLDFKNDTEVTMANTITKEERKFKYKFNSVDNKLLLEHNGNYELFGNIKRLTSDGFGIKNPDSSYTTFSRIQEIKIESTKNEIVNALKNSSWVSKNEKHSLRIDFMDNHRWDSEKQPYVAMFHHGDSAIEKRYETWDIGEYSGKLFLNYSNDQSFYIANQITEFTSNKITFNNTLRDPWLPINLIRKRDLASEEKEQLIRLLCNKNWTSIKVDTVFIGTIGQIRKEDKGLTLERISKQFGFKFKRDKTYVATIAGQEWKKGIWDITSDGEYIVIDNSLSTNNWIQFDLTSSNLSLSKLQKIETGEWDFKEYVFTMSLR
jgi:hypothetical protein